MADDVTPMFKDNSGDNSTAPAKRAGRKASAGKKAAGSKKAPAKKAAGSKKAAAKKSTSGIQRAPSTVSKEGTMVDVYTGEELPVKSFPTTRKDGVQVRAEYEWNGKTGPVARKNLEAFRAERKAIREKEKAAEDQAKAAAKAAKDAEKRAAAAS